MLTHPKEACFPAGTDVWTDKGLVPIEKLKVGDLVLSQDEISGTRDYKRVTQTFEHENQAFRHVRFYAGEDEYSISATSNHPVWIVGEGWKDVETLERGDELLLAKGMQGWYWDQMYVYKSVKDGGDFWYYDAELNESWPSSLPEGATYVTAAHGLFDDLYDAEDPEFRDRVYNIEVEDFHTYFVGDYGLWVHNKRSAQAMLSLHESTTDCIPAGL